jgi:hypothetical protein
MHRLAYILVAIAILTPLGCATDGEIRYTGQKADAREADYIKDPEATGVTRDGGNRNDTTRTDSNRVDIPVLEFAQLRCEYSLGARTAVNFLTARYSGQQFDGIKYVERLDSRRTQVWLNSRLALDYVNARANETLYKGMESRDETVRRLGRDKTTAYSMDSVGWFDQTRVHTSRAASREQVDAIKSNEELRATRSREGFFQASGERIIGLHLFKYANRELVGDGVEVTYTLVYYNTNEYDTGPTEINEPVPYYTSYITGSATLPRQGTKVDFIARPGDRDLLRWSFPQGIKAGETGEMKYKVKVILDAPYEQRPPEDHRK